MIGSYQGGSPPILGYSCTPSIRLYSTTVAAKLPAAMKSAFPIALTSLTLLVSCSAQPDPIGRGGAHFQIDEPLAADLRDKTCGAPGVGGIGSPKAESDATKAGPPDLPTPGSDAQPFNMGSKVTDGQRAGVSGNYQVDCTITGKNSYTIDAHLVGPNTSTYAPKNSGETSISLSGTIDAATGLGSGEVYVRTTETGQVIPAPNRKCSLRVLTNKSDASIFLIKPGSVDLTFVCEETTPNNSTFSRCETRGTVTLDDCIEK